MAEQEVVECPCGCGYPLPPPLSEEDQFDAGGVMETWVRSQGMTMADLRNHNRLTHMVEARRRVAAYLRHHHWSLTRIGHFLDRDHTTVVNLLKGTGWTARIRQQRVGEDGRFTRVNRA